MLFWMARRTVRSGGSGCLGAVVLFAVIGGIISATSAHPGDEFQAPAGIPAGPYGWAEDTHGHFQPAMAPIPVGVPFIPPYATPAPPTGPTPLGMLTALLAVALVIGGLALIGRRMTPAPITPRRRNINPCCGTTVGQPHATSCRQHPPGNPAQWSDRR